MSRLQADLALLLAGLIWGFGFVAQKTALDHIGPATFVASRFLISAIIILPFVFYEKGFPRLRTALKSQKAVMTLFAFCSVFSLGVIIQQYGLMSTTVTKAAFLNGIYIVMVPFIGYFLYRQKLSPIILVASLSAVAGIWLLSGGGRDNLLVSFNRGDTLILICALCMALQVTIIGHLAKNMRLPFTLSFLQYIAVGLAALIIALSFETIEWKPILDAWFPILFSGIASGGIAYTLQAVGQQHTPPAEAGIMMSSEALFGGIGGVWLLNETLTAGGLAGCALIIAAVIMAEMGPLWQHAKTFRRKTRT